MTDRQNRARHHPTWLGHPTLDSQKLTISPDGRTYSFPELHRLHQLVNDWLFRHSRPHEDSKMPDHYPDTHQEKPCMARVLDPTGRLASIGVGVYSIFRSDISSLSDRNNRDTVTPPILGVFPISSPRPHGPHFAVAIRDYDKESYLRISAKAFTEWISGRPETLLSEWNSLHDKSSHVFAYLGPMLGTINDRQLQREISLGTHTLVAGYEPRERISATPLFKERKPGVTRLFENAALLAMRSLGFLDEGYSLASDEEPLNFRDVSIPLNPIHIFEPANNLILPQLTSRRIASEGLANIVGAYWESLNLARELQQELRKIIDPSEQRPAFISVKPIDKSLFLHQDGGTHIAATMESSGRTIYLSQGFLERVLHNPDAQEILAATLVSVIATCRRCQEGPVVQALARIVDPLGKLEALLLTMAKQDRPVSREERDNLAILPGIMDGERLEQARRQIATDLRARFSYEGPLFSSVAPAEQLALTASSLPTDMGKTPFRSIGFNLSLIARITEQMAMFQREISMERPQPPFVEDDPEIFEPSRESPAMRFPVYRLEARIRGIEIMNIGEAEIMSLIAAYGLCPEVAAEVIELMTDGLLIAEGFSSSLFGIPHLSEQRMRALAEMTSYYFDRSERKGALDIGWLLKTLHERLSKRFISTASRDFRHTMNLADKVEELYFVIREGWEQDLLFC